MVANLHHLQYGIGTAVATKQVGRLHVDDAQLDHFLEFITSPHIVQDCRLGRNVFAYQTAVL